eukprot:Selendium_serpulae@DN4713_c0_g1_i1.p1
MCDNREVQTLEIEALRCLYTHGELSEPEPNTVELRLVPDPECLDNKEKNKVEVSLWVQFTEMYPSTLPNYDIKKVRGLNQQQVKEIKSIVEREMNNSLGMEMIYGIADEIQDWLRQNNRQTLSMHDEMMAKSADASGTANQPEEEESEQEDEETGDSGEYKGLAEKDLCNSTDRLTKDMFDKWKVQFQQEMEERGIWKKKRGVTSMTGKIFFQQASGDISTSGQTEFVCENEDAFLEVDDVDLDFADDQVDIS